MVLHLEIIRCPESSLLLQGSKPSQGGYFAHGTRALYGRWLARWLLASVASNWNCLLSRRKEGRGNVNPWPWEASQENGGECCSWQGAPVSSWDSSDTYHFPFVTPNFPHVLACSPFLLLSPTSWSVFCLHSLLSFKFPTSNVTWEEALVCPFLLRPPLSTALYSSLVYSSVLLSSRRLPFLQMIDIWLTPSFRTAQNKAASWLIFCPVLYSVTKGTGLGHWTLSYLRGTSVHIIFLPIVWLPEVTH